MRALLGVVALGACSFSPGRLAIQKDASELDPDAVEATDVIVVDDVMADMPAATCPIAYDITIASSTSVYRAIGTEAAFAVHHGDCNDDAVNATHLASFETATEIAELTAYLSPRTIAASRRYYVGAVQQQNQASETAGWLVFTGAALPANQWSSGQPNDDGSGENNAENIATLNIDDKLNDATGDVSYGGLCECDGMAVPANVLALLP